MSAEVRASEIFMLPDRSVVWSWQDVPSLGGKFALSPQVAPEHTDLLTAFADRELVDGPPAGCKAESLGYGWSATVWGAGSLAIKSFYESADGQDYGLESLQANLAMEVGLRRISQTAAMQDGTLADGSVRYKAPILFGAFIPHNPYKGKGAWVMSREEGEQSQHVNPEAYPDCRQRAAVYNEALAACGSEPYWAIVDDKPENLLIARGGQDSPSMLVKLDVMPASRWPVLN